MAGASSSGPPAEKRLRSMNRYSSKNGFRQPSSRTLRPLKLERERPLLRQPRPKGHGHRLPGRTDLKGAEENSRAGRAGDVPRDGRSGPEVFDSVIDSGLFHVFKDDRRRYVEGLATVLKPGGRLFPLCFSDEGPGTQGPRRVPKKELDDGFMGGSMGRR